MTTTAPQARSTTAAPAADAPAWERRGADVALGAAMLLAAAVLVAMGDGLTFYYDEWEFLLHRRSGLAASFLEGHNGHLSLTSVAIYRVLMATVGLEHYLPYRLVGIAAQLVSVGVVYAYARRRVRPLVALAAAGVLLLLGSAWQDLLWPFQTMYFLSLAAGAVALLALDSRRSGARLWAGAALVVSLSTSGLGIPLLAIVAVDAALRPDRLRRLPVVVVPAALYGAWYLLEGGSQQDLANLPLVPLYTLQAGGGAFGALTGLGTTAGIAVLGAVAALIGARLLAERSLPPRLAGLAVGPVAFWALTGLSRAQLGEPDASRYLYPGAFLLVLLLVEAVRDRPLSRRAGALVLVAAVASTALQADTLSAGAAGLRHNAGLVLARLAALELVADHAPADYRPAVERAPQITAGAYLDAVAAMGSPADLHRDVREATAEARAAADEVLREVAAAAAHVEPTAGAASRGDLPACGDGAPALDVAAAALGGSAAAVAAGGAPVEVRLHRFADSPPAEPWLVVEPGDTAVVRVPPDRLEVPWRLTVAGGGTACALAPAA